MVEVEPGFGVGTPGVLDLEEEFAEEVEVGGVAGVELAAGDPGLAEADDFAVAGYFEGIAGDAVDPGVSDFVGDEGEMGGEGLDGVGDGGEAGGADFRTGEAFG